MRACFTSLLLVLAACGRSADKPHVAPAKIAPAPPGTFTIVVLPDTQGYTGKRAATFEKQVDWILDTRESLRTAHVLHVGDIVNWNGEPEWVDAERIIRKLDGKVPYVLTVGNHDMGPKGSAKDRTSGLHAHFPAQRYAGANPGFGGVFEEGKLENSYHLFSAGGVDWMVLALEFGPRDETLAWANQVTAAHPDRKVIVLTHCYTYSDGTRVGPKDNFNPKSKGMAKDPSNTVNDGDDIWEKYVRRHASIVLVVSGHITQGGAARQVATGDHGNQLHEVLANYQQYENGGDGWLRIFHFDPEKRKIAVTTYSPTRDEIWADPAHTFTLELPSLAGDAAGVGTR